METKNYNKMERFEFITELENAEEVIKDLNETIAKLQAEIKKHEDRVKQNEALLK